MGSTPTASKPKPSPSDDEAIVELLPPPEMGFSGTAKLLAVSQAAFIAELITRGYTKVSP